MTFRVMSVRTMDHAGQVVLQLRHGGTMSPYACDRDEGKLHRPNWGLDAAESGGSSRGTHATDRAGPLQVRPVGTSPHAVLQHRTDRCYGSDWFADYAERWKETSLPIGHAQSQRSELRTARRSASSEQGS